MRSVEARPLNPGVNSAKMHFFSLVLATQDLYLTPLTEVDVRQPGRNCYLEIEGRTHEYGRTVILVFV